MCLSEVNKWIKVEQYWVFLSQHSYFLNIYYYGLNQLELNYLKLFFDEQKQVYLSLETISSLLNEEVKNIEYHCEPLLLELLLIIKTSKGRTLTKKGFQYLQDYFKNK